MARKPKKVDTAALKALMQSADIGDEAQARMLAANEQAEGSAPTKGHGAVSPNFQSVMGD